MGMTITFKVSTTTTGKRRGGGGGGRGAGTQLRFMLLTRGCKDLFGFENSGCGLFLGTNLLVERFWHFFFVGFHVEMNRLLKSLDIFWVQFYLT